MTPDRLIGNQSRLPLPVILSLRSQWGARRALTLLTVLAFATSVGLAASVEMATRSLQTAMRETTDALAGAAQIEISAGDAGLPEDLLEPVRELPEVVAASPLIETTFRVDEGPHEGEPLRVIAIDLLYEHEVRNYQIQQGGFVVRDPLRLVAVANSIVISQAVAERFGVGEGGLLRLRSPAGTQETVVRGLLHGSLSDAYGGQLALMDVFGLQELLGLGRRVHRIDVAVESDESIDAAIERIQTVVGELATVRRSAKREIYVDSIMETLNAATFAVALIGILLSLFLTYAVTSLTVDRRLEEISLLRATGMSGRSVAWLILVDAALLAAMGSALGFALAAFLGDMLVQALSRASEYLQLIEIEPLEVRPRTLLVVLAVGVPVALLAAVEPALRVGRRSPVDVLRGYRIPPSTTGVNPRLLLLSGLMVLAGLLTWATPGSMPGPLRLAVVVITGVVAVGAGASQLLLLVYPQIQSLLGLLVPRVGYLIGSSMLERPMELGATLAVWAAISAGVIAGTTMIQSVAVSWDAFNVGLYGPDATNVYAQDPLATRRRELIRVETIEQVRQAPGVRGVAEYYVLRLMFRGEEVSIENRSTEVLQRHSGARGISDDPDATIAALLRGELAMNNAFARHFGVEVGDTILLSTSSGPRELRVGAMAHGFAGPTGELYLDTTRFLELFRVPGAVEMAIWTDAAGDERLREIQRSVREQTLFFRSGENFRRHTQIVVAKFNDLLMLPVGMVGTIGVITLLNLLFGNVMARRRDLAILRGSGGTRGNLRAVVLLNAVFVGALGTAIGLVLGIQWGQVATEVVAGVLGYPVYYVTHGPALVTVAASALVLAALSALAPALSERDEIPRGIASIS